MEAGEDPLDVLIIPTGTIAEERDLVATGDVIIGGQSNINFGIRSQNIILGERVHFEGDIEVEKECRVDIWCEIEGNVLVGEDAYLGERVSISGKLVVGGDLDIGDDVRIEEGFEANGWINIRNPLPTIIFLFMYLTQLLRLGEEEAAEELLSEILEGGKGGVDEDLLVIPRGSHISDEIWRVSTPVIIKNECRLHGNFRAVDIKVGEDVNLFGSIRARENVVIGKDTRVHGDVTTREGDVVLSEGSHILGDVSCNKLELHEGARVEGTIRAKEGMQILSRERKPQE